MIWRITWETDAVADLIQLSRTDSRQAGRVFTAVRQFERNGSGDVRALTGRPGEFRLRVGDWRVLMRSESGDRLMTIIAVRLRRDAYD